MFQWPDATQKDLFSNRCRPLAGGMSTFEIIYGSRPHIVPNNPTDSTVSSKLSDRRL